MHNNINCNNLNVKDWYYSPTTLFMQGHYWIYWLKCLQINVALVIRASLPSVLSCLPTLHWHNDLFTLNTPIWVHGSTLRCLRVAGYSASSRRIVSTSYMALPYLSSCNTFNRNTCFNQWILFFKLACKKQIVHVTSVKGYVESASEMTNLH